MVVMLKQCCCGCSLKTGSLIIAIVFIIIGGLELLLFINVARDASTHLEFLESEEKPLNSTTTEAPSDNHTAGSSQEYDDSALRAFITFTRAIFYMSIVKVVFSVIEIFVNVILIYGANNDSVRLLLAWVVGFPSCVVCSTLLYLAEMGVLFHYQQIASGVVALIVATVSAAAAIYCWLVGFSFYRQLRSTGVARRLSQQQDDQ